MRLMHLLLALIATGSLQAQRQPRYPGSLLRPNPAGTLTQPAVAARPRSTERLVLGALAGSVVGLGAGLLAYSAFDRQNPCFASDCDSDLGAGLVAATAGMTITTPLGAHLANRSRGTYHKGLLLSGAVAAGVWGGAALADDARWLLLLPPAQIAASVLTERRTTR